MKARDEIKQSSELVERYDITNCGTIRAFCSFKHIEGRRRFRARLSGSGHCT